LIHYCSRLFEPILKEVKKLRRLEGGMNSLAGMDDLDGWMNG